MTLPERSRTSYQESAEKRICTALSRAGAADGFASGVAAATVVGADTVSAGISAPPVASGMPVDVFAESGVFADAESGVFADAGSGVFAGAGSGVFVGAGAICTVGAGAACGVDAADAGAVSEGAAESLPVITGGNAALTVPSLLLCSVTRSSTAGAGVSAVFSLCAFSQALA